MLVFKLRIDEAKKINVKAEKSIEEEEEEEDNKPRKAATQAADFSINLHYWFEKIARIYVVN